MSRARVARAPAVVFAALLVVAAVAVAVFVVTERPAPPLPTPAPVSMSAHIVVALPRAGPRRSQSEGITNAVQLAVSEANGRVNAGNVTYTVDVQVVDTAGVYGEWSEDAERTAARQAAADPSVVAYIGPGTPQGATIVAPIAADAKLLVVTPTLTDPALTERGYDDALYAATHPGDRTVFVRTIPSDESAARAMLAWAAPRSFAVDASGTDDWSIAFRRFAANAHLLASGGTRFFYLGGMSASDAADHVRAIHGQDPRAGVGGAETLLTDAFLAPAGATADGVVATFAGRPIETYTGPAALFLQSFRTTYLVDPDPYAIFGYDAARLVLDALERSDQTFTLDRGKVRDAAFSTKDLAGALGKWSVETNGDTTYRTEQLYVVRTLPDKRLAWTWESEIRP